MKYLIFLLVGFCFFPGASAQQVSATTDRQKILIGEPFTLLLEAEFSDRQKPSWFALDTLPHFEIMERSEVDTQRSGTGVKMSQRMKITSWDSGIWQIPALVAGKAKTKPIKIDVAFSPSPFDVNQPYHDIRDIIEVKKPLESKWYWYLGFLLLLIILFLLFFPPGKKKVQPVFVPDEGAFRTAMRKLDALQQDPPEESKIFFTQLVNIYREYLSRSHNIRSFSKTTDDLAIRMDSLDMPADLYRSTIQVLRLSDMVKYARFQPSTEEKKEATEIIRESITNLERTPHAV